ncbi:MAG: hypothetical protein Q4B70_18100 [Lachnospiraceae bacterium]|nr:hypothetical protein [Lachnospiraceae bacterium]
MHSFKKIFLLLLIGGTLFLTGCGIRVATDLSLDQDFKGSRTITCFVSASDMLQYFKGDSKNIDNIIENNCPDCLIYSKKETDSGTEYQFRLEFQSLEDYKTSLGSVLNFSPEITYHGSSSVFSKGISIQENFTSLDLLRWFEVLLQEEYNISDSQIESLWEVGDTKVEFSGTSYESEPQISISSMEYSDFDGIEIYTTEKDDRTYERLIRFKVPTSTLNKHSAELEDYFADHLPKKAEGIWVPVKTGKNYELTLYADSFSELSSMTAVALDCTSEQQSLVSSTFSDYQFFQFDLERTEQLDFSYFLCTKDEEVPVAYYYKPNSLTEPKTVDIQKKINNNFTGKADKNGFYCLFDGNCTTLNVGFLGEMNLFVSSYQITTILKDNGALERSFTFTFQNDLIDPEIHQLNSFFKKNKTAHLTMKGDFSDEIGTLTITQKGTKDDLNYSSRLLFGSENNSADYKEGHSLLAVYQDTSLTESIDLSRFLGSTNQKLTGEYVFINESSETLNKFSIHSGQSDISYKETNQNNHYMADISGCLFTVSYTGSLFDPFGMIVFVILLLALVAATLFLIRKNPMNRLEKF